MIVSTLSTLMCFWMVQNPTTIVPLSILLNGEDLSAKKLLIYCNIDGARAAYSFWNHHCDLFILLLSLSILIVFCV